MSDSALDRLARRLAKRRDERAGAAEQSHYLVVVDDEPYNLDALERLLRPRYKVTLFAKAEEALAAIEGGLAVDLVLTDQRMPGMTGVELLTRIREHRPQCMGLVVSGYTDKADLIAAINEGHAFQYITKPWVAEELLVSIGQALEYHRLLIERDALTTKLSASNAKLAEANAQLEQLVQERTAELRLVNEELQTINERLMALAVTDPLTGLYNHGYFQEFLTQELRRSARYSMPVSVIMADVDYFKSYNDQNGHQAGDQLLKNLGELFRSEMRESDVVARYGGEEFIFILPQTALEGGKITAERLRAALARQVFPGGERQPDGRLTASFGLACFDPTMAGVKAEVAPSDLIARADEALYRSKRSGRNKVTVAE